MIIKMNQFKSEYVSSVYVHKNSQPTPGYVYWKFPLPKFILKDNTGLAENEAIMITPYNVEVLDGNTDYDITVDGDYVVVRPKPAVVEHCFVGNPALNDSNHPLNFIKYYYTLNGVNVEKTCVEIAGDSDDYICLNGVSDGFEID